MALDIDTTRRKNIYTELSAAELAELALLRGEGQFAANGAIVVKTGKRTGRSPKDRFIVKDRATENTVDWGAVNQPVAPEVFDALWDRVQAHLADTETFVSHLHVGADPQHYLPIEVTTEYAWHALFGRALFIRPERFNPKSKPLWQVVNAPGFVCVSDARRHRERCDRDDQLREAQSAARRHALRRRNEEEHVLGAELPAAGRTTCCRCTAPPTSATISSVTLFFGLSGTGKTTLSADPGRYLIGDDEHGWGKGTVFNLEGGCYAKCINLTRENEPVIYDAIRFGAIVENVVIDPATREPDYADSSLTENSRACYPLDNIAARIVANRGGEPNAIIFLTCDVSGVSAAGVGAVDAKRPRITFFPATPRRWARPKSDRPKPTRRRSRPASARRSSRVRPACTPIC